MHDGTIQGHGRADVLPSGHLLDGEHVAGMEAHIGVCLSAQRRSKFERNVFAFDVVALLNRVAREFRDFNIG